MSRRGNPGDPAEDDTADVSGEGPHRPGLDRGTSVGRYLILDEIAKGGMGVVYKAYDPELDRPVAVKLLRIERNVAALSDRLLREAQALARLSHPNVIAVYDVGTFRGDLFIAMEFVDGQTVRHWLAEKKRGQREILEVFLAAGEGLAAAHGAALVHRDFKPDNVMIGKDGRVRVLDFGVARATQHGTAEGPLPADSSREHPAPTSFADETFTSSKPKMLLSELTQAGATVGTPRFMAPEQHLGAPVDDRVDQFNFCVALYWALYDEYPFAGLTPDEYKRNVLAGRFADPPAGTQVPRWLRQVLMRGLAPGPTARHPSMGALLAQLRADPRAVRRRWLRRAAAIVVVGAAVGGWRFAQHQQVQACAGDQRKLAGVWDDARRSAVRDAFHRSGKPYADAVLRTVERAFDGYAHDWTAMRADACEATLLRHEQSQELLDLRMSCLSDRLTQLKTLAELYSVADGQTVERAAQSAESLPPLDGCADVAALRAPVPPPADAETRRRVDTLRQQLAQVSALDLGGKYDEGLKLATAANTAATALRYRPVEAEAKLRLGQLQSHLGDYEAASRTLRGALIAGMAGRHDEVAALAATNLASNTSEGLQRYEEANGWADLAEAAVERLQRKDEILGTLHRVRAMLSEEQGHIDDSLRQAKLALELELRTSSPQQHRVALAHRELGRAYYLNSRYDEALASYQRSLAIDEAALGTDHPVLVATWAGIANVYADKGDHGRAIEYYQKALQSIVRSNPDHPNTASLHSNMGMDLQALGRLDEAFEHFSRALTVAQKTRGPSRSTVVAQINLGAVEQEKGHPREALRRFEDALAVAEKVLGPTHVVYARAVWHVGDAMRELGRASEALSYLRRAPPIIEKALGPTHLEVAEPLLALGRAHLALHDGKSATEPLERTVAIYSAQPAGYTRELADTRFALAQAVWLSGDHPRALVLATQARDAYAAAGARAHPALTEATAWLKQHPTPAQLAAAPPR